MKKLILVLVVMTAGCICNESVNDSVVVLPEIDIVGDIDGGTDSHFEIDIGEAEIRTNARKNDRK